ncbi:hypothetical protein [Microcoleus sp. CAWBG24]|nr:hypothetical protein [Microcoleus sp. CAWBG24]
MWTLVRNILRTKVHTTNLDDRTQRKNAFSILSLCVLCGLIIPVKL